MAGSDYTYRWTCFYHWVDMLVYDGDQDIMKTKECPSCAMDVPAKSKVCPVCQYEFAEVSVGYRWIAIGLIILFLLYLIF